MAQPEWAPWVLATVAAGAIAWSLVPAQRDRVDVTACEAVALVDGRLVCAQNRRFEDACGVGHVLRAGDTLDGCRVGRMPGDELAALEVPIDPNEAGPAELQSLPGIGPVLARRIVEGRPYSAPEALLEVKGVGPRTLARIRSRLRLRAPRP